ncbi:MAG: hypothetical protein ACI3XI_05055 [Eubacteriales bacterium]
MIQEIDEQYRYHSMRVEDIPDPEQLEVTITVFGEEYTGTYVKKKEIEHKSCYGYKTDEGDYFEIDSLGNLTWFETAESFKYEKRYVSEKDDPLSPEESLAKATEILKELVGVEEAARFEAPLPDTSITSVWSYFRPIDRKIGEYTVPDRVGIWLTEKGEFLRFIMHDVGFFEGKELPDGFNDEKVKEIILTSLGKDDLDIELSEKRALIVLDDGTTACSLSFRPAGSSDNNAWIQTIIPVELKDAEK